MGCGSWKASGSRILEAERITDFASAYSFSPRYCAAAASLLWGSAIGWWRWRCRWRFPTPIAARRFDGSNSGCQ